VLAFKVIRYLQEALCLKGLNILFGLGEKQIFILFSVIYFKNDIYKFYNFQVPERVRAMNASIKLLLIVREPVTRAISDYTQLRSHAATAILPLAEKDPPSSARESSGGGAGGTAAGVGTAAAKMSAQSVLYAKLQSARGYDNALVGGSGAGAKETKGRTGPSSARRQAAGVGGAAMTTTTLSPMASAAQMAAK